MATSAVERRLASLEKAFIPDDGYVINVGSAETLAPMLQKALGSRARILESAGDTGQFVPAIAGPGPHYKQPARDPALPFGGRYGSVEQMEAKRLREGRLAGYGCGLPDGGRSSNIEPDVGW